MSWASLLEVIKHMASKLKLHWFLFFLHEGAMAIRQKKEGM
jgi:hypothetical protein